MDAQASEERAALQTPVVTITVGGAGAGSAERPHQAAPTREVEGLRPAVVASSRTTIRHRRNHACSALPCRLSPIVCVRPAP